MRGKKKWRERGGGRPSNINIIFYKDQYTKRETDRQKERGRHVAEQKKRKGMRCREGPGVWKKMVGRQQENDEGVVNGEGGRGRYGRGE